VVTCKNIYDNVIYAYFVFIFERVVSAKLKLAKTLWSFDLL